MKISNSHSKLKERREPVKLLILPSAAMLLFISMIPLLMLIVFSFVDGNITTTTGISGFTLDNFKMAFSSSAVPSLMAKSFYIALIVTLLCIIIGYPAAWAIAKVVKEKNRSMFVMLSIVPALVSQLLLIYSIMQLLQSGGVVMTLLERLGICSASDSILYTTKAVVLVLVYEYLPYMILCLYSCLEKIDDNVLAATHTLGAGRFRTFVDVALPQSFSGLLTGILVIFIPVAGSFVEPDTVGGPYSMMIGSLINTQFNVSLNMGYGATLSFLLLVLMSLALALINLVMKLAERKIGG